MTNDITKSKYNRGSGYEKIYIFAGIFAEFNEFIRPGSNIKVQLSVYTDSGNTDCGFLSL